MANNIDKKPKTIGVALGGGGAKGLAHIGVLKTFLTAGFKIDYLAGTSMGALVGGLYAATGDISYVEDLFLKIGEQYAFHGNPIRKKGKMFFKDETVVEALLAEKVRGMDLRDTKIPFRAIAMDIRNGEEVVLERGDLVTAIRASCAMPVAFNPVAVEGKLLVDGGFVNPVPTDVVREMGAEFVVGVDISSEWPNFEDRRFSLVEAKSLILDSFSILEYQIARVKTKNADLIIRPPVLNFRWDDFRFAPRIIRAGSEEAMRYIREIRAKTNYPTPPKKPLEKFVDFLFGNEY